MVTCAVNFGASLICVQGKISLNMLFEVTVNYFFKTLRRSVKYSYRSINHELFNKLH